nr:hypothetical protein [Candidatus Enterovibrio escacola]
MNNLDAVFVDVDDFCQTFPSCMVKTPNFFRHHTKKQTFSSLRYKSDDDSDSFPSIRI